MGGFGGIDITLHPDAVTGGEQAAGLDQRGCVQSSLVCHHHGAKGKPFADPVRLFGNQPDDTELRIPDPEVIADSQAEFF